MTGQAGQFQPGGQNLSPSGRGALGSLKIFRGGWVLLAVLLLAAPFNRGGLWDPQELRFAELGRRLSHQLFGSNAAIFADETLASVTKRQIGQGELAATSPALGFALFGVSDWAGRVASLGWGIITILCLWMVISRIAGRMARVVAALCLVSLPLFAWQTRTMLGDAATIGTLAMSTTGLLLVQLEMFEPRASRRRGSWLRYLCFGALASVGLGAGVLCRGILVGVCVPTLSVGLVGIAQQRGEPGAQLRARLPAGMFLGLGVAASAFGVRELLRAPAGFSFWLGATLSAVAQPSPVTTVLTSLLHQAFPLSALLPISVVVALSRPVPTDPARERERTGTLVLVFTLVLGLVVCGLFSIRGVTMPFPALAALAGISGVAVERLHQRRDMSGPIVGAVVMTVAVLLFADFVNQPDTVTLTTGLKGGKIPESFGAESQIWLGVATAVLGLGCLVAALAGSAQWPSREPWRARYARVFERMRSAYGGQLMSGFVLVETALGTTGLLQRAHARGWISVPVFDSIRTIAGPLLAWAWLLPPALLFVMPMVYTTLRIAVDWLLTPRSPLAPSASGRGQRTMAWLRQVCAGAAGARVSVGSALAVTTIASGLVVSLGHAPAMTERLSPKRAIAEYRRHAGPGELLAVLGLKAESVRYYLGAVPETFGDIEAAARWLEQASAQRRWLTFGADRLAELNAAFRSVASGRNLVIVEPVSGNTLLATSRLQSGERDYNPLRTDISREIPKTMHRTTLEFGHALRVVGWDVKSTAGESVSQLTTGEPYELQLVFEVLGTTAIDWEIFVHLDGFGRRHNGDHEPVTGRYPTTLWQPGDIVIDRHKLVLDRASLPGTHELFFGLFRGSRRFEVTTGKHEDNRVKLGELTVR